MPATPSWCCGDILTNPSPKTERSTSIFAISGWSCIKTTKDRFPWDAPGSSAGHQNGGQRLAQPHFPRYFDHGRNHHPFLPLQKRYAGTLRLFAERNPCGGRAPALFEIRPHRRRAGHAGAVIVMLAAGLGAIWVILHLMKVPLKRAPLHLASLRCLRMMLFSGIITLWKNSSCNRGSPSYCPKFSPTSCTIA